jgi:hypothetical protein
MNNLYKANLFFILFFPLSLMSMKLENDKEILLNIIGSDLVISGNESDDVISDDQPELREQKTFLDAMPENVLTSICFCLDFNDILSLRATNKNLSEKVVNLMYPIDNLEEAIFKPIDELPFCNGESSIQPIKNIISIVTDHVNRNANTIAKRWYDKSLQVKKSGSVAKVLYKKLCLLNRTLTYKDKIDTDLKRTIKTAFKKVLKQGWLRRNNISITEHKKIIKAIAYKHGLMPDTSWPHTLKGLYHRLVDNPAIMTILSMTAIAGIFYTYLNTQNLLKSPKYLITKDDGPHWKYINGYMSMIRPLDVQTQYTCYDTKDNNFQYKSFYNHAPLFGAITTASYIVLRFLRPVRQGIQKILRRCTCYEHHEDYSICCDCVCD